MTGGRWYPWAVKKTSLYLELKRAKEQPQTPLAYFFNRVVGESPAMRAIYKLIQKAAPTNATVLVRGESGSGKELLARAVHVNSPRRAQPYIKVDCAARRSGRSKCATSSAERSGGIASAGRPRL